MDVFLAKHIWILQERVWCGCVIDKEDACFLPPFFSCYNELDPKHFKMINVTGNVRRLNVFVFNVVSNRIRKIKEHDSEFKTKDFAERAQEIFIEAHNSLAQ